MKIALNLASQPYVDVRSVLKRLRLMMLALIVLAIPLFLLLRAEQKKAQRATDRVAAMQSQVQALERRQSSYQALMRQPQNASVLNKANYLNGLFRRKSFSWTATMTDLETVLPSGVQVLSLDPAITKSGEVVIHLRVSGARDRAIALIQNLEKSHHFASPRLAGETLAQSSGPANQLQPVSASSPVNFDILADYRPLTDREMAAGEKSDAGAEPAKEAEHPAPHKAAKRATRTAPRFTKQKAGTPAKQEAR